MKTILVVDDMAVLREPIALALRARGFQPLTAADGVQALEIVEQNCPDLILLDIAMPRLDGLAVLRRLQDNPRWAAIPVILLTAVAERDYVLQAARLGVRDYLLKSRFSLAELFDRIDRKLAAPAAIRESGVASSAGNNILAPLQAPIANLPSEIFNPPPLCSPSSAPGAGAALCSSEPASPRAAPGRPATPAPQPLAALKSLAPILSRAAVTEKLRQCQQLKAFSPVVVQVLKLANNPRSSLDKIVRAISQDQAIALKILKLANSVAYSRGEPVDSIQMAVSRIGMERIRQAVFNIGVIDQFGPDTFKDQLNFALFWEHAIGVGVIAAELAAVLPGDLRSDTAFTLGLLHDVGRVVCLDQLGDDYARILHTAAELELPLEQVENRMMLVNHAEVMDVVLRAWRFHDQLITPIASHHLSADNLRKAALRQLPEAGALALANRLAHALLLGTSGNHVIYPTEDLCRLFKLDPAAVEHIAAVADLQTTDIKSTMLSSANHASWTSLRDQYRAALPPEFRPLFVSLAPRTDAFRLFCEQLAPPGDEQAPTLGVVHLTNPRERGPVTAAYLAAEAQAQAPRLPLLVLSPSSAGNALTLEDSALLGRDHQVLTTPLVVSRFLRAVRQLLPAAQPLRQAG